MTTKYDIGLHVGDMTISGITVGKSGTKYQVSTGGAPLTEDEVTVQILRAQNRPHEFKSGDKARCVKCNATTFTVGKIYQSDEDGIVVDDTGWDFGRHGEKTAFDWLEKNGHTSFEPVEDKPDEPKPEESMSQRCQQCYESHIAAFQPKSKYEKMSNRELYSAVCGLGNCEAEHSAYRKHTCPMYVYGGCENYFAAHASSLRPRLIAYLEAEDKA